MPPVEFSFKIKAGGCPDCRHGFRSFFVCLSFLSDPCVRLVGRHACGGRAGRVRWKGGARAAEGLYQCFPVL